MRSLLFLLLLLLPLSVSAQNRFSASFFGGYSKITEPDQAADWWKDGFNAGIRGGFVLNDNLEFTVGVTMNNYGFDRAAFSQAIFRARPQATEITELGGGNIAVASVMVGLRGRLNTPYVQPYAIGGVGFFRYTQSQIVFITDNTDSGVVQQTEQSSFGAQIGGGVEVPVTPVLGLFIEGRYVVGLLEERVDDGNGGTLLQDIQANSIPVSVGFRLRLGT